MAGEHKALVWDNSGEKFFENGVKKGVLYPISATGTYPKGVAWNGLTSVNENPSGADENKLYADDIKYASLFSAEEFGCTIEAYTYPEEFAECDGSKSPIAGVYVGQQKRKAFGFSYRTNIGNDVDSELGYKIHLVYNANAQPSGRSYATINESPDAITMSWEVTTTPIAVGIDGYKPTSVITIDSTKVDSEKLTALEKILYGSDEADARLPLPEEVFTLLGYTAA